MDPSTKGTDGATRAALMRLKLRGTMTSGASRSTHPNTARGEAQERIARSRTQPLDLVSSTASRASSSAGTKPVGSAEASAETMQYSNNKESLRATRPLATESSASKSIPASQRDHRTDTRQTSTYMPSLQSISSVTQTQQRTAKPQHTISDATDAEKQPAATTNRMNTSTSTVPLSTTLKATPPSTVSRAGQGSAHQRAGLPSEILSPFQAKRADYATPTKTVDSADLKSPPSQFKRGHDVQDPSKENLPGSFRSAPSVQTRPSSASRSKPLSPARNQSKDASPSRDPKSPPRTRDAMIRSSIDSKRSVARSKSPVPRKGVCAEDTRGAQQDALSKNDMELPLAVANEVLDSTCIMNGSIASVVTCSDSNPVMAVACIGGPQQELDISQRATTVNAGQGQEQASFRIVKCSLSRSTGDQAIRYGDAVALCSPLAGNRALGLAKTTNSTRQDTVYEVGFYRSTLGQAEQWTILWGGSPSMPSDKRAVVVGSQALSGKHSKRTMELKAAVRSADCILLRNNATGGLLSSRKDELTIVTHSYSSSGSRRSSPNDDTSLLNRLQHHSRIIPRQSEMFQFMHTSVPSCPQWVLSRSSRRFYLDGSYLLYPQRNEPNANVEDRLFSGRERTGFFEGSTSTVNAEVQGTANARTVQEQEMLLLDEAIGSMLGLEGHHVKVRPIQQRDGRITADGMEFWLCDQELVAIDTSLRNLVERILSLSSSYVRVQAFVSSRLPGYEYGSVMQALCEGLDCLLQEYLEFVSGLEHSYRQCMRSERAVNFSMSSLYANVKESMATMHILEKVVAATRSLKGGALLNELRLLMTSHFAGDDKGRRVLEFLLERSSVPYMNILSGWLEKGLLQDPYGEFMVESSMKTGSRNTSGGEYDGDDWDDLYRIRDENVLEGLLSTSLIKQKLLETGKCWNAARYCRRTNRAGEDDEDDALILEDTSSLSFAATDQESGASILHYGMDQVSISSHIDRKHQCASKCLVQLILQDFSLTQTLSTIKRFFLFDQGDFFIHFLDFAETELLKELKYVSRGQVQHWLSMCVQLNEGQGEETSGKPLAPGTYISLKKPLFGCPLTGDDLRCRFAPESLEDRLNDIHATLGGIQSHEPITPSRNAYGAVHDGITGMEAFMLDFGDVPFPTNLIISKQALGSYQLLFRHLFFAKHVERRLVGVWMDHQMMKELQSLRKAFGPTYCLRQRMIHFMQNLIYYIMFEVIEPNWTELGTAIHRNSDGKSEEGGSSSKNAQQTVGDIRKAHNEFLKKTQNECLLTNRDLIRTLTRLMNTCLAFSEQLQLFLEETKISDENYDVAKAKRHVLQRNLNDPSRPKASRNAMRQLLAATKEERENRIRKQTARVNLELSNGSYERMVSKFDKVFTEHLAAFMNELQSGADDGYHSHRQNLCIRLDYNGYVSQSLGDMY